MKKFLLMTISMLLFTNTYAADFTLTSPSFKSNQPIPRIYTCDGSNISPPLNWQNVPANTQSFVLTILSDWSSEKVYLWALYQIPNTITSLKEAANKNLPSGILMGSNYYRISDYSGPCPPDDIAHRYEFTLYALDTILSLPENADPSAIEIAMTNHILGEAKLTATYQH